ncbi:MAG: hypothetical protein M5U22_09865 [Thermoleophilia bacterium]|nr:hypothetical protein [Thermoleophilia bacterium]
MGGNMEQQQDDAVARIQRVVEEEARRLYDDPNVAGVGFGIKRRGGQIAEGLCVRYIVHKKIPDAEGIEAVGSSVLPVEVEGFPTDVVEIERAVPHDNGPPTGDRGSRKDDPLVGGGSTTVLSSWHSFPTGFGTLGGICFDSATGEAMALSNAHVWGMEAGRDVIQPWMPTEEYLEAVVKLLACGPVISYLIEGVVPSPLTAGLAAGAAAAWVAAAASDGEDPSRWGQGETGAPPAGARTQAERIHLAAEVPARPFPGFPYTTKTLWQYERDTTAGSFPAQTEEERKNEHLLVSKRVWTDRAAYHGGERVRICAEVATQRTAYAADYFVVAHCFPSDHRDRLMSRVLSPGECETQPRKEVCFHGFPPPAKPGQPAHFPFSVDVFRFSAGQPGRFVGPWPAGDPQAVTVLQIPWQGMRVELPPASKVTLEVFHMARPVEVRAYDASGLLLDSAAGTAEQGKLQVLSLSGPNIQRVDVGGGGGEGFLVGMCAWVAAPAPRKKRDEYRFVYTGHLDLAKTEPPDRWGVVLFVQTVDNLPPGTDPVVAARTMGGVTASANVADLAGCTCVMLLDHVFDVI